MRRYGQILLFCCKEHFLHLIYVSCFFGIEAFHLFLQRKTDEFMKSTPIYIIFTFLFFSTAIYSQINVKDSLQIILANDTIEPEIRFRNAYNLMFYNSSPEEAEILGRKIVYPFVQTTWKSRSEHLSHLARLHLLTGLCYRERGGDDRNEKERLFVEKALETALKSEDNEICARCYMSCGFIEMKRGDVKRGNEYLYQAITFYDKMEQYVKSSEMLYVIVSNFFDIKDVDGMKRVLLQMEEYLEKDNSKQSQYQYNVLKKSYFEILLEKEKKNKGTIDSRFVDSTMVYIKKIIYLAENHLSELSPYWMHGYAYYYMAKGFDDYYPEQTDSIFFYLDKAHDMMEKESFSRMVEANSATELKIFLNTMRVNALSREGRTEEAYKVMSEALSMLDELKNYQNLNELRYRAYQFMADYYEKINRFDEALKYQKLLRENESKRYESEKIQAINDMSAKYETEKKEIRIQTLIRENETARRILWLIIGLSLALLTTAGLIILSNRLKRKNAEQRLYETALLAELRQNELEKIQHLKKQLDENPVKNTIEKIAQGISASLMDKEDKKAYLERLSKIDFGLLESAYQSSKMKITGMDMKYIICFAADIDVKDISLLFNIEPASVHTVRYRIKKKFPENDTFRMILQ